MLLLYVTKLPDFYVQRVYNYNLFSKHINLTFL